ncbi:LCP family protein [Actinosynnema pretiosum subsp. pretiosum]|uniref:LCP family protein n=1 Tax=Actinosynnema pretiosum subsp. pretiosum TaxID=103721 RepID=A0AA45L7X8_9PSEU|nr:Cell envelope-associated transcriptional attenuator LytR-CpsA-Psr, subfamily A1 [Actinosynnema pretiosum subsp. pretiosum]QUF04976.1 LCP family protein [Actinosynnema pretiosum subsp. pretiosum]
MTDQEALIRAALAAQAEERVDHRAVAARVRTAAAPRRRGALIAAGVLTAAAAVAAAVVPMALRDAPVERQEVANSATAQEQTVLLLGVDTGDGADWPSHADTAVLLRIFPDGQVSGVSLPRDLRVTGADGESTRLAAAYGAGRQRAEQEGRDAVAGGAGAALDAVEEVTGVRADHWAAVSMNRFAELSDLVGGVKVCLSQPARDEYAGVDLAAGEHVLRGGDALGFLRQRHGLEQGDLDRVTRMQAFLQGLRTSVRDSGVLGDPVKLTGLFDRARDAVRTDDGWDLAPAAAALSGAGSWRFATLPGSEGVTDEGVHVMDTDPAQARAFVAEALRAPSGSGTGSGGGGPVCVR